MTICWTLTETGLRGTENQCIALAAAAGLSPELKRITLREPWRTLTPWLRHFAPRAMTPDSSRLSAPWPGVLIASGRKAIAAALWVKKQNGGRTILVIIQNPVIKSRLFDLVIVPQHDRYRGKNVLVISGALSLVTPENLAAEKEKWAVTLEPLPVPRIAVLIGGNSRAHRINDAVADRLITQLQGLLAQGYGLMVTASRRTPQAIQERIHQILNRHCGPDPQSSHKSRDDDTRVHFWDGHGDNPYHAYLAWSDTILVTADSVSMASEAISTGKPVAIIPMAGGSKRFRRFHDYLIAKGYARWFDGSIDLQTTTPPDDMALAVARIKALLAVKVRL